MTKKARERKRTVTGLVLVSPEMLTQRAVERKNSKGKDPMRV